MRNGCVCVCVGVCLYRVYIIHRHKSNHIHPLGISHSIYTIEEESHSLFLSHIHTHTHAKMYYDYDGDCIVGVKPDREHTKQLTNADRACIETHPVYSYNNATMPITLCPDADCIWVCPAPPPGPSDRWALLGRLWRERLPYHSRCGER